MLFISCFYGFFLNFLYFPSALPIILSSPFNNPLFPNPLSFLSSCSLLFNSLVLALYPAVNSKTDTTDIYGGRISPFNPTTNHTHVHTAHTWSIETVAFPLRVAYKPCIDWVAQQSFNLCADTVAYSTSRVNTPQLWGKGLTTEDIEDRMERVCQSNSNRCVANWINTWKQEKEEKDTEHCQSSEAWMKCVTPCWWLCTAWHMKTKHHTENTPANGAQGGGKAKE